MRKVVRFSKDRKKMYVIVKMEFNEFQDLRSYMNVACKEKNYDFVSKCFDDVPKVFHECLTKD